MERLHSPGVRAQGRPQRPAVPGVRECQEPARPQRGGRRVIPRTALRALGRPLQARRAGNHRHLGRPIDLVPGLDHLEESDTLGFRIASLKVSSQPNMPVYFV